MAKVSPWNFYHGRGGERGPAGHRLSRFKKSAGDRAVNDGKTSVLIQSWPTLCEKKIIKCIHLQCYNDVKYCYTVHIKKKKNKGEKRFLSKKGSNPNKLRCVLSALLSYTFKDIFKRNLLSLWTSKCN